MGFAKRMDGDALSALCKATMYGTYNMPFTSDVRITVLWRISAGQWENNPIELRRGDMALVLVKGDNPLPLIKGTDLSRVVIQSKHQEENNVLMIGHIFDAE